MPPVIDSDSGSTTFNQIQRLGLVANAAVAAAGIIADNAPSPGGCVALDNFESGSSFGIPIA
jgi:hypothetical protein